MTSKKSAKPVKESKFSYPVNDSTRPLPTVSLTPIPFISESVLSGSSAGSSRIYTSSAPSPSSPAYVFSPASADTSTPTPTDAASEEQIKQNMFLLTNRYIFVRSLVAITNMIVGKIAKASDLVKNKQGVSRLHDTCVMAKNDFIKSFISEDGAVTDTTEIYKFIKKVYRTLTSMLDMFVGDFAKLAVETNTDIFFMEADGKKVTILPGMELGLVVIHMNDVEKVDLWCHLYVLYVSSVHLLGTYNPVDPRSVEAAAVLEKRLCKLNREFMLINIFVGAQTTGEINTDTILSNMENIPVDEKTFGAGMFNGLLNKFREGLSNITPEDLQKITVQLTTILGAKGDVDVESVCTYMINEIVNIAQTKETLTMTDLQEIAKTIANDINAFMGEGKMKKTANYFMNMCNEDNIEKIKNIKDEKGNAIGQDIYNALASPMHFVSMMNGMMGKNQSQ